MATGPEHYQAAELLLDMASDDELGSDAEIYHVAKAQVHATLALAAATALGHFGELPAYDAEAWLETASTQLVAVEDLDGEAAAAGAVTDRADELRLLAGAILASFTKGQDGYRARVGQVQIERWSAALDGAQ